jgi:hypothetical protein
MYLSTNAKSKLSIESECGHNKGNMTASKTEISDSEDEEEEVDVDDSAAH